MLFREIVGGWSLAGIPGFTDRRNFEDMKLYSAFPGLIDDDDEGMV